MSQSQSQPDPSAPDPSADEPLTAEAAALLAAMAQAHVEQSPTSAGAQAASASAMTERGPVLPAEADMNKFMAEMRAKYNEMAAQLEAMKAQQAAALASAGGPLVTRYAQGAADKVAALAAQHPDAPQGHFAAPADAAAALVEEAAKLAGGATETGPLKDAFAALERFATRTHHRLWPKSIDWSAVLYDAEEALEAGIKLAAAA